MSSLSDKFNVKDYSGVARLSLGTTDAESSIHVRQANANIVLQNLNVTGKTELKFKSAANASQLRMGYDDDNSVAYISEEQGNPLIFKINDTEKLRLTNNGNLGVGKTALSGNKVCVAGNVNVDTGNAYKVDNTIVLNATKLGDNVFNSSLKVVGELTSLAVSGATELKDTLDVSSTLTVAGAVDINAAMDVSGVAQLASLNVSGNTDIDGTLNTAGVATFQNDLIVDTNTLFVDASSDCVGINNATPAYELDVIGSGKFSANLIIDGNLTVQGTSTTMNTEVVTIEDPLISLGANNSADAVDLGFYSKYNDGSNKWTGLFRDASTSEYNLFDGSTAEPSTIVDVSNAGYGLAKLNLSELQGTTINASTEFIGAALKITGNSNLDGTLDVAGTAQLNALNVTNDSALSGDLTLTGAADFNSSMNLQGAAVFQSTLQVDGAVDINAAMDVSGAAQLASLNVSGDTDMTGNLLVSLNTTIAGDLRVDTDTFCVDSTNHKVGINITNPDNELDVNGVIQARNDMVVQGNLIIKGTNASSGDLNAIWAENIYGEAYLLPSLSKIGIGITNPQYEFDVVGDINLTGEIYHNGALHGPLFRASGTNAYYNAGNLGIGITAPTKAKLEVAGDYGSTGLSSNSYTDLLATGVSSGSAGTMAYSIYADGKIAASSFHAVSDKRVKNILSERNNNDDLEAIENLDIFNYQYIDQNKYGKQTKIGIMAQDVEKIHSDLVEESTRFIPNIYKECKLNSINEIQVGECDIKEGDLVQVQYQIDDEFFMCEKNVVSYTDGIMKVSESDADADYKKDSAFVYGKQINDFKSVNFEQLTSLNTSAIKAIIQENKDLKAELAAIKEYIGM
jgi:cytoskeletal protein CcmA (bactofilin family)